MLLKHSVLWNTNYTQNYVYGEISTVGSHYLEFQATFWNTSRYPYLEISELQNWGQNNSNKHF